MLAPKQNILGKSRAVEMVDVEVTYHLSLYGVAVIPRPAKTVWLLMNISLRDEKTAPFVIMRSLAMLGSDTMMNS